MSNLSSWFRGFGSRGPDAGRRQELRLLFKKCQESLSEVELDHLLPPVLALYVECFQGASESLIAESMGGTPELKRFATMVARRFERSVGSFLAGSTPLDLLSALRIPDHGSSSLVVLDMLSKGPGPVFEAFAAEHTTSLLARIVSILPKASADVMEPKSTEQPVEPVVEEKPPMNDEGGAMDPEAELRRVREFLERDRRGWGERRLASDAAQNGEVTPVTFDDLSAIAQALFSILRRSLSRPESMVEIEEADNRALANLFEVALMEPDPNLSDVVIQLELRWKQSSGSLLEDLLRARLPQSNRLLHALVFQGGLQQALSALAGKSAKSVKDILDLLFVVLMESVIYAPDVIDGFKAIGGYESLSSLILTTSDRDVQDAVISFLEKLVYIGGRDMLAELQPREAFHFQHSDFRLPPDNGGPCVRNRNAFSALTETFLRATNIDAPAHFHAAGDHISKVLMGVLRTNPLNYFILESSGAIISLVEKLDTMRLSGQEETLRLLEFALIDVNYVPFKELACLCVYFTHNSTSSTTAFVADWLVKLLSRSKRLASNFRDIGMVSMLANMVKELATSLRDLSRSGRNAGDPSGTISLVDVGEPRAPDALPRKLAPRFAPIILDNFEAMMRLALKLLEGDRESCLMWTRSSKGALVDLLPVDELRGPLLRIIRTITTVRTAGPSSPSTVDPDRDLNKILELILSAPARNVLLKADLLEAFGEIMATSPLLRETFRTSGGFATCIQVLSGLEGAFLRALPFPDDKDLDRTEATTKVEEPSILRDLAPSSALSVDLASCARLSFSCLKVLLGAIKNDDTARGLLVVELDSVVQTFRLSGILQTLYAAGLVGSLFALALEDSSLQMLFVSNFWESTSDPTGASSTDVASTVTMPVSEADASSVMAQQTSALRNNMARSSRVLRNPAVLVPILSLLPDLGGQAPAQLAYGSLVAMHGLSLGNRGNQARMGGTGMLMRLLKDLYSSDGRLSGHPGQQRESHLGRSRFSDQCRDVARILAMRLLEIGIASEDELRYLFEQANPDLPWLRDDPAALNDIADVLLHGVKYGRTPSHVHFDHRSSSISGLATGLAECGSGLFPSYGWSLSVWIRVHDFDPLGNVNVVTILPDGEGSPVLSVVIEGRSRKVMVQAGNSQMLFENFALRPRKWYHMVIVHSRSRMSQMTSSSITLSIDGIVAENARFAYPNPSPRIKEAIFGIVAEEASSGPSQLVWDLGTCHFLADCLDPDSVNIIYNLGPQYRGNFQDSLKKYQTYEIIDSVNLDYVNHGNEDGTDLGHLALATAVVRCGGSPVTEDQILFTLSASNEIADYDGRQLARSPQKQRNVLVNSSHPRDLHLADWSSVNSMAGVARLYGNAVRMSPNRVVDGVWRIGGCALIVSFIEKLQTPELLLKGISILVESIRFNWRNTEDMEKEHLYEAFANILRDRVELLTPEAVEQLLVLVGKLPNLPTEAVLSNTMAYRFLFLDFELWRKASRDIQKLVLSQFQDFTVRSRKRVFNAKRLGKLFLTKRLLMALRTEVFGPTLLPDVVKVIRSTLIASFNVDSVRAIATFIMSTLPQSSDAVTASSVQEEDWSSRQRVSSRDDWQRRGRSGSVVAALGAPGRIASFATEFSRQRKVSTMYSAADGEVGNFVPLRRGRLPSTLGITTEPTRSAARFDLRGSMLPPLVADAQADEAKYSMPQAVTEMRNLLLECLVDIVCCEPGDNPFVSNFAQMITARWFLLFVDTRTSSRTVVLGTRLMAKVLSSQSPSYLDRFRTQSQGFVILSNLLPRHWNLLEVHLTLLALAFGVDPGELPAHPSLDVATLSELLEPDPQHRVLPVAEGIVLTMTMVREMMHAMIRQKSVAPSSRVLKWVSEAAEMNADTRLGPMRDYAQLLSLYFDLFERLYDESVEARTLLTASEVVEELVLAIYPAIASFDLLDADGEIALLGAEPASASAVRPSAHESPLPELSQLFPAPATPVNEIDVEWQRARGENVAEMQPPGQDIPTDLPSGLDAGLDLDALHLETDITSGPTSIPDDTDTDAVLASTATSGRVEDFAAAAVDRIENFVVFLCVDSVIGDSKPLVALENVMKASPPSTIADQKRFRARILAKVLDRLIEILSEHKALALDPRLQGQFSKLAVYAVDKLFQGWFAEHAALVFDFIARLLESVEEFMANAIAHGRIPLKLDTNLLSLYRSLNKTILFELKGNDASKEKLHRLMTKCSQHQRVVFSAQNGDPEFYRCLISRLWRMLSGTDPDLQMEATALWKLMLLQKPSEVASVLKFKNRRDAYNVFVEGFSKLLEMDMTPFKAWLSHHKNDLQLLFAETVDSVWDNFVYSEEKAAVELEQASVAKRLAKLKRLSKKDALEKSTVAKYREKTAEWLKDVQENEYLRYRRFAQDALDTQVFVAEEWATTSADIRRELGLWDPWANSQGRPVNQQQLDFVEGPLRMRRKLRRSRHTADLDILSRSPSGDIRASPASTPVPESPAFVQARPESRQSAVVSSSALDPLAEELEVSTAQSETGTGDGAEELEQGEEEGVLQDEDKNRKIARLLEAGDTVLESFNAARVTGLDICEGLMLICRDNIYLIDNYTRRSDGELDDIDNVPEEERNGYNLILSASASPPEAGRPRHACRKWAYDNIKEVHKRKFLFRNVGLEIFLLDGRNFLVTLEPSDRDMVYNRLLSKASTAAANRNETMVDTDGLSVGGKITSILFSGGSSLSELTAKWERWEISNFEYLMRLNTLAGRSYNDLTQFPVFPWVVADYTSAELDLTSRATFRDLAKPMGAQTAERAEEFEDRFKSWEDPEGRPAFHYGTHYSSSMIVCSFLIRMEPFTQQFLKLQGGHLDHADRLFHSLEHAWLSASKLNTTDVRELVPEFYCNPEFLRNANMYDFGIRQSGERINDVVLPPWARGDPRFFVSKLRQALESNYVSQHLHEWIDLIFGVKQSGAEAAKALNVFHHLSYEGAVDMDAISDPVEKQATIGIIHNFGQTPRQLFRKAHPPRMLFCPVVAYKIYRQPQLLFQAPKILAQINQPVHVIWVTNDHIAAIGPCRAIVPMRTGQAPSRFLEWGYVDASVRVYQLDTGKLAGVFESLHTGQITCAGFADDKTFVLAGTDMVITVWRFGQDRQLSVELMQVLRGHQSAVTCLAVSRAYNLIISGAAQDNHALVWDLNRLIFVRRLLHPEPVRIALVNEVTGDILLASELYLSVFTVNGELLACRQAAFLAQDAVLSAAFFTGDGWADADVVVSGHRSGAIKIWKLRLTETISSKETEVKSRWNWTLELAATLQPRSEPRPCTALYVAASQRYLLGGDNVGRVTAWLMPEGSGTEMHFSSAAEATSCTSCRRGIGGMAILVDKRFNCTACGSIFCADCVGPLPLFSGRFCISCAERAQGSRPEL